MTLALIQAKPQHIDEYARIARETASPFNLTITEPAEIEHQFRSNNVQIIQLDGISVGVVALKVRSVTHVYIDELGIDAAHRSQGLGGKALDILFQELASLEVKRLTLVTHPEGEALRFYQRHGFVLTGKRIENYQDSGTPRVELARKL